MRGRSVRDVLNLVVLREVEEEEGVAAVTIPMACPTSSAPTIPTDVITLRGSTITIRRSRIILLPLGTTRWEASREAHPASNRAVDRNAVAAPPTATTPRRVTTPRASKREGRISPVSTPAAAEPRGEKRTRASPIRTATTVAVRRATVAPSEAEPFPPPWGTSSITIPAPATTRRVTVGATIVATEGRPTGVPRRPVPSPSRRRTTTNAPCGGTTSAAASPSRCRTSASERRTRRPSRRGARRWPSASWSSSRPASSWASSASSPSSCAGRGRCTRSTTSTSVPTRIGSCSTGTYTTWAGCSSVIPPVPPASRPFCTTTRRACSPACPPRCCPTCASTGQSSRTTRSCRAPSPSVMP
mmetsp:Transcript_15889/g.34249  ORF Transcript_15889/g.34249 Transcript_15889/m.34249 type:complete len:358 (+) Transcript_15889:768-1841(+)